MSPSSPSPSLPVHPVELTNGRVVSVRPLPLGVHRRLLERGVVPPQPPQRVCRDSQGRVMRDERGLAVVDESPHEPRYLAERARYDERVAALLLAESLVNPAAVFDEWPTPPTASSSRSGHAADDWLAYADAVLASLGRSDVTAGDFLRLCEAMQHVSGLSGASLDAAGDALFPTAAGSSSAGSTSRPMPPAAATAN